MKVLTLSKGISEEGEVVIGIPFTITVDRAMLPRAERRNFILIYICIVSKFVVNLNSIIYGRESM